MNTITRKETSPDATEIKKPILFTNNNYRVGAIRVLGCLYYSANTIPPGLLTQPKELRFQGLEKVAEDLVKKGLARFRPKGMECNVDSYFITKEGEQVFEKILKYVIQKEIL